MAGADKNTDPPSDPDQVSHAERFASAMSSRTTRFDSWNEQTEREHPWVPTSWGKLALIVAGAFAAIVFVAVACAILFVAF
ncbi:hypothetical protein [Demequina sp.]|uniref:hypothetical protein n=1 Tax=Demequina sp. TaxID=2050685 RepID=UPI003D0E20D0